MRNLARSLPLRLFLFGTLFAMVSLVFSGAAQALPSFAIQTDQPCSACHVGSFGPQLKPFGRDFKLYGYTSSDGKPHNLPVALYLRQSFTHTDKGHSTAPANRVYGADSNDNFALDEASGWIAGRVNDTTGVYLEGSFDGVGGQLHLDNADARHIHEGKILGYDYVGGITVNDAPTVSDIWNSTPVWGFPFNSSKLATGPAASTLIDGNLGQKEAGLGAYVMLNDWVYLEFDAYKPFSRDGLNLIGNTPATGVDRYDSVMPYWRAAIQHELVKNHYFEIGTYGISGEVYPADDHSTGAKNRLTDTALDFNYQWLGGGNEHFVSAHSTFIHENLDLTSSHISTNRTNPNDRLNTFRAEVSYSYEDTYTPTAQYFRTWGTTDANQWNTTSGSPNSEGFVMELAYVPFGKPDSPVMSWFAYNSRLELQYTAYTQFDGARSGASNHNTIFLDLGIILSPKW